MAAPCDGELGNVYFRRRVAFISKSIGGNIQPHLTMIWYTDSFSNSHEMSTGTIFKAERCPKYIYNGM